MKVSVGLTLALALASACGDDDGGGGGADAAPADAPLAALDAAEPGADAAPDATPLPDAGINPTMLWLAGINGSESNLQLISTGEPPFF